MTSYGSYLKTKILDSFNIIIGNINNIFEYTTLSIFNRNQRPVLFYQNENQKNIPLSQAFNRIYQQMVNVSLVGAQTNTSLIDTSNSLGSITRIANYDRLGTRYKVMADGELVSNSASGELTFNFLLGGNIMVSSGVIPVPNLNGDATWFFDIEFVIRAVGEAGTAILASNGKFELTNKKGVELLFPLIGTENTNFNTTETLETDIQITTNAIITSYSCNDVVYFYLN